MNNLRFKWMGLFLFTAWIIAGCGSTLVTPSPGSGLSTPPATLKPYLIITPTPTLETGDVDTPVPIPSPSPTPRTHTVKAGESFGTIATLYGVSVDSLIIANPDVNPNAMSIGIVLTIPAPFIDGEEPVTFPTPLAVIIQSTQCYEVVGNSIQCFISVSNPLDTAVEGVSAVLRYQVSDGNVKELVAYSLLNAIPAGATAPLLAAFPSDTSWDGNMTAEIRSAIPAQIIEFPGNLEITTVEIADDGSHAWISGVLENPDGSGDDFWLVLVALDSNNLVVGARRFTLTIPADVNSVAFRLQIFSLGESIADIQAFVEPAP